MNYKVPKYIRTGNHYPNMTYDEVHKAYNGVGPAWFPKWARNILDFLLDVFYCAVVIHDCDYDKGEGVFAKIAADFRFLLNMMLCIVFELWNNWPKAIRFLFYAIGLYLAVVLFGHKAFYGRSRCGRINGGSRLP